MARLKSVKWLLVVVCLVSVGTRGVAFAHGGHHYGGGHHHWGGHHYGGGYHHYGSGVYYRGSGYGSYGGYYGGYGNYGYGNYGYGSNYYSQPVYAQPTYVSPAYSVSSSFIASASQVASDGGEIVLFSPLETGKDVQYSLNGSPFVMKPGGVQRFSNDRTWTIDINTGNGQALRYTLLSNRYKFKPSENGIGLFSTVDQPGGSSVAPSNTYSSPSATMVPAPTPAAIPVP